MSKDKKSGGRLVTWTEDKRKAAIEIILTEIAENGKSVRAILTNADRSVLPSNVTFCEWLVEDSVLAKQYAHACVMRADYLIEEGLSIIDDTSQDFKKNKDGVDVVDHEHITRSKARWEARRWFVSKLNSKKYGDKIDMTTDGESINKNPITINLEVANAKKK